MEEGALAMSMATLLIIAMICTIVFKKLKMPAIVGYLAAGIILANAWDGIDDETTHIVVGLLSNLGLALLMFSIGMELNFEKLKKNGAFAVLIVLVQVPIVLLCGIIFGSFLGWGFTLSISMGAILAGSSTAVVLVVQKEKQVLDQSDVDTLLLILVVEDVVQVIMMSILTPMMESASSDIDTVGIAILLAEILAFMIISTYVGIRFVPRILNWIGDRMDREILIISAFAFCFGLSALAIQIGMSTAVGAFLMGVIVSQCRHVHEIEHSVEPMKDVFMGMFFISIGLEVNPSDLVNNVVLMVAIFFLFVLSRTVAIYIGYFLGNKPSRLGFVSATSLVTMGEFAFIISSMAFAAGVMDEGIHAAVIGAALLSMIAQSFITGGAGRFYDAVSSRMPAPVLRFSEWTGNTREKVYLKMDTMSRAGLRHMKKLAAFAYFSGLIIFVIVLGYVYFGSTAVEHLASYEQISDYQAAAMVNISEFFLLLAPCSLFVANIKSLIMYLIDPAERAKGFVIAVSQEDFIKRANNINLWVSSFALAFLIMMLSPNHVDVFDQILFAFIGMAVFIIIGYVMYRRKLSKSLKEQDDGTQ